MVTIKVSVDVAPALRLLGNVEKQARFATAVALTRTAGHAQRALTDEMGGKFDRPTPYTLRSTWIKKATKALLVAEVMLKDRLLSKTQQPPGELLAHHFNGQSRMHKGLERYLMGAGLISRDEYVVPGAGVRLDRYGNMSRGQIQQIISQLKVGLDSASYASDSARSRRSVKKAGRIFWSRGGHLPRGAWIDMGNPVGIRPLLMVAGSVRYQRRINLPKIAQDAIARHFDAEFAAAFKRAMETAR